MSKYLIDSRLTNIRQQEKLLELGFEWVSSGKVIEHDYTDEKIWVDIRRKVMTRCERNCQHKLTLGELRKKLASE